MRPLIIGMDRPTWSMLHEANMNQSALDAFERRDLGRYFDGGHKRRAHEVCEMLFYERGARTVILLGNNVYMAFNEALDFQLPELLVHPQIIHATAWRQLPHPSDRSPWYTNPEHRKVVAILMNELLEEELEDA